MTQAEEKSHMIKNAMDSWKLDKKKYLKKIIIYSILTVFFCFLFGYEPSINNIKRILLHDIGGAHALDPVFDFLHIWFPWIIGVVGVFFIIRNIIYFKNAKTAYKDLETQLSQILATTPTEATNDAQHTKKWTCTCGRELDRSVSSCVCGVSLRDLRLKAQAKEE